MEVSELGLVILPLSLSMVLGRRCMLTGSIFVGFTLALSCKRPLDVFFAFCDPFSLITLRDVSCNSRTNLLMNTFNEDLFNYSKRSKTINHLKNITRNIQISVN